MLFNSFEFICLFLPATLLVFFWIGSFGRHKVAITWLVATSLFFYGWWNPAYLWLLVSSLIFNYLIGSSISKNSHRRVGNKLLLTIGIISNLALLSYYKYANFFVENVNVLLRSDFDLGTILLPLGISFFTFQQVAYLVDAYRGETKEYSFLSYCLFVCFFPQLIAGPIVHHKEVMPQFNQSSIYRLNTEDIAVGVSIFAVGLAKKVFLADTVALSANPVFTAATSGADLSFFEAWFGAIAYSLQLYFDFSGYSDMAVGAARMFGIKLPINFDSPYKSTSITEFWRRWHITLSNFLRDYLYIPLGGNRKGKLRRYLNLMATMLLGGLWHGAGWTFVFWGGLHGIYLVINHGWNALWESWGRSTKQVHWSVQAIGWVITSIAVVVSWVFFRATDMSSAFSMLAAMLGTNGFSTASSLPIDKPIILGVAVIALFLPNTQQWFADFDPVLHYRTKAGGLNLLNHPLWSKLSWRPNWVCSLLISGLAFFAILKAVSVVKSEFLYFNF